MSEPSYNYVELPEEALCPVCLGVNLEPFQLRDCGHLLCEACLKRLQTSVSNSQGTLDYVCPKCRGEITNAFPDVNFKRLIIDTLKVRCDEKKHGCNWIGDRVDYKSHLQKCLMEEIACVCGISVQRRHLDQHSSLCPQRLFSPGYCDYSATMRQPGTVSELVKFLGNEESPQLQFDAARALAIITSWNTEETIEVMRAKAVPVLIRRLSSCYDEVQCQALLALGNIAGFSAICCGCTIRCRIIQPLLTLIEEKSTSPEHMRKVAWVISKLCFHKNLLFLTNTVRSILPSLGSLINHNDKKVVSNACWAFSHLTDGSMEHIQSVIEVNVVRSLIQLLSEGEISCMTPSLKALGHIVKGNNQLKLLVLSCGLLVHFEFLLTHQHTEIQKEAVQIVSNITACQQLHQAVVDAPNLIPTIINVLAKGVFDVQKEAVRAVTNLTIGWNPSLVLYIINLGAIEPLCNFLAVDDAQLVLPVLYAITNMLAVGQYVNKVGVVWYMLEDCEALKKIMGLVEQRVVHVEVCRSAFTILCMYLYFREERNATTR